MRRLKGYAIGVDRGSTMMFSDFENNGPMWGGQGQRAARVPVAFTPAFRTAPVVHVSISMWDVDHRHHLRADISAEDVTPEGFTLVFRTWGDTRIARLRADWMAIGEVSTDEDWEID